MGVTVHFEGRLRGEEALAEVVALAETYAESRNWPISRIDEPEVMLRRVKDEEDWDYVGPVRGVVLNPHENADPFRLEFDKDLYVQEYTKTQFAPVECHKEIVALLRQLESYFESLTVEDEGEFYETKD